MTQSSFGFIIRDAMSEDIELCLELDATYETDYVWQTDIRYENNGWHIMFRTERMPRPIEVDYPINQTRFHTALRHAQCVLIAIAKNEPEVMGCLVMQLNELDSVATIEELITGRAYRRHRIGTRLLNVARQWAREREARLIIAHTQTKNYPAIQFCQANGLAFCGYNDQLFANKDIAVSFSQVL